MTIGNGGPAASGAGMTDAQLRAEASNPATSPQRLHELASTRPDLHVALAANPSLYPGLREWLASLGNPEVDAALAGRAPYTPSQASAYQSNGGFPAVSTPTKPVVGEPTTAQPAPAAPAFAAHSSAMGTPVAAGVAAPKASFGTGKKVAIGIGVVALLVIVFMAAFLVGRARSGGGHETAGAPEVSTEKSGQAESAGGPKESSQKPEQEGGDAEEQEIIDGQDVTSLDPQELKEEMGFAYMMQGGDGYFPNVGSMSEHTSQPFTADVLEAYNQTGANGKGVDLSVYSEGAERVVDLTCVPVNDAMVNCYGGRSVNLYLFK